MQKMHLVDLTSSATTHFLALSRSSSLLRVLVLLIELFLSSASLNSVCFAQWREWKRGIEGG